jgi:hypothetical protein
MSGLDLSGASFPYLHNFDVTQLPAQTCFVKAPFGVPPSGGCGDRKKFRLKAVLQT